MDFLDKKKVAKKEVAKQQGLEEVAKQQGLEEIIDNGKAKTKATRKRVSDEDLKARKERNERKEKEIKEEEERIAKEEAAKKAEEERIAKEKAEAAEKEAAKKETAEIKVFDKIPAGLLVDFPNLKAFRKEKDNYVKDVNAVKSDSYKKSLEKLKEIHKKYRKNIETYDELSNDNDINWHPDEHVGFSNEKGSYERAFKIIDTELKDIDKLEKQAHENKSGGKRRKSSKTRKQKKQKKNKSKRMKKSRRSK